jgi:DNA-binding CsgD family transcriptional regulator
MRDDDALAAQTAADPLPARGHHVAVPARRDPPCPAPRRDRLFRLPTQRSRATCRRVPRRAHPRRCRRHCARPSQRTSTCPPTHRDDPIRGLSPREREVVVLVAEGKSNTSISRQLVITERTVETHMRAIFRKLNIDGDEASHWGASQLSPTSPTSPTTAAPTRDNFGCLGRGALKSALVFGVGRLHNSTPVSNRPYRGQFDSHSLALSR